MSGGGRLIQRSFPLGDADGDVAADDGLAAEAGGVGAALDHADEIEFVLFGLTEVFHAGFDVDVASGAGAVAATDVIEREAEVHGEVENRAGLAVAAVGNGAGGEFVDGFVVEKRELGHGSIFFRLA